jgi:hypothetical protein
MPGVSAAKYLNPATSRALTMETWPTAGGEESNVTEPEQNTSEMAEPAISTSNKPCIRSPSIMPCTLSLEVKIMLRLDPPSAVARIGDTVLSVAMLSVLIGQPSEGNTLRIMTVTLGSPHKWLGVMLVCCPKSTATFFVP